MLHDHAFAHAMHLCVLAPAPFSPLLLLSPSLSPSVPMTRRARPIVVALFQDDDDTHMVNTQGRTPETHTRAEQT